jgi:hypothetical protein
MPQADVSIPQVESRPLMIDGIEPPAPAQKEAAPAKTAQEKTPVKVVEKAPAKPEVKTPDQVKEPPSPAQKGLADLQAREREIYAHAHRVREREAKVTEQSKSIEATRAQLERLKTDPIGVLNEIGLTFNQLADAQLAHLDKLEKAGKDPALDPKFQKMEKQLEQMTEAEQARQTQAHQEYVQKLWNEHLGECSKIIGATVDDFETILSDEPRAEAIYQDLFIKWNKKYGKDPQRDLKDPENDEVLALLRYTEELMETEAYEKYTKYDGLKKIQTHKQKAQADKLAADKLAADKLAADKAGAQTVKKVVADEDSEEPKPPVRTHRLARTITNKLTPAGSGEGTIQKRMSREEKSRMVAEKYDKMLRDQG